MKGVSPVDKGAPLGSPVLTCSPMVRKDDSPAYAPGDWNDGGTIQKSTNCYAYAMNSRLGHKEPPDPGEKSNTKTASPLECASTSAAVVNDGQPDAILQASRCPYNQQQKQPPPDRPGYYLVALVQASRIGSDVSAGKFYCNDYHWYRQDDDGTWSHKPGDEEATKLDAASAPITNPETAARRSELGKMYFPKENKILTVVVDYDVFCGYFYVKKGGVSLLP